MRNSVLKEKQVINRNVYIKPTVIIVASVASMIDQFTKSNIQLLQSMGYAVDVATNFDNPGTITNERCRELLQVLDSWDVDCYQIDFSRSVYNIFNHLKAYKQLIAVFDGQVSPINKVRHHDYRKYTFMHCHSPIGAALGRIVAYKRKVKSIYTAHGFHFYKGAPVQNWIIFYPIESLLSRITDVLITINKEDYRFAQNKFHKCKVFYIPGVGIDEKKFTDVCINRNEERRKLGIADNELMILSVGELNDNKNHKVIIEALKILGDYNLHYVIAGKGDNEEKLKAMAVESNVQLHLLGYRTDIPMLLKCADIFVLPSLREGLNVSLMEALTAGVICIASKIRGNVDLIQNQEYLVNSGDAEGFATAIKTAIGHIKYAVRDDNTEVIESISDRKVLGTLTQIYEELAFYN